MKFTLQILSLFLIISCKTVKPKQNLIYTIINKESISEFKTELEIFTKAKELKGKNIDFIAFKDFSVGSVRVISANDPNNCQNCLNYFSTYLIWEENNIQYIQIFDNCGNFYPVKIQNENILEFVKQNLETLKTERVKFYQVDESSFVTTSHSRYKEFLFSINNEEVYNYFDTYNLKSDSKKPNLNYSFNQNLNLIQLNNMIEEEIKNQNDLNAFKRDLTKCK